MITNEQILELASKISGTNRRGKFVYVFNSEEMLIFAQAIEAECQADRSKLLRLAYNVEKCVCQMDENGEVVSLCGAHKEHEDEALAAAQARIQELRPYLRHGILGSDGGVCEAMKHSDYACNCGLGEILATTDNHAALDAAIEPYRKDAERLDWCVTNQVKPWTVTSWNEIDEAIRARTNP